MEVKIFWCKVNKYYTDKWLKSSYLLDKTGVFIASCVVTDKAKRKWVKFVKEVVNNEGFNKNEDKIFITWCWAFKDWEAQGNFFDLYPDLKVYDNFIEILWEDPDINNEEKNKKIDNIKIKKIKSKLSNIKIPNLYTKKFVLIQWWCDSFCSFCLTVVKRWRHFFRAKEDILEEILDFELSWWKEVVLTGVNLSAWWLRTTNDIKKSRFSELLEFILDNSKIERLRISSLWPEFIDDKCLDIFKNERIYPHFHFSVQSWSTEVLKWMKRHYDWEYIKKLLLKTKNINRDDGVEVSIWADIIVWFPWEDDSAFQKTFDLIKDTPITKLHAFPFSPHDMWESVPAWDYPKQLSDTIKKERMNRVLSLWEDVRKEFIELQKWKQFKVLIESVKWNTWKWWTQNYIEANELNFNITNWNIKRNEIVVWILN